MKHVIERIISGTLEGIEEWVNRKALLTLVLALLLIKSFPKIAMVLFVTIGVVAFRNIQQRPHLAIEVDPI